MSKKVCFLHPHIYWPPCAHNSHWQTAPHPESVLYPAGSCYWGGFKCVCQSAAASPGTNLPWSRCKASFITSNGTWKSRSPGRCSLLPVSDRAGLSQQGLPGAGSPEADPPPCYPPILTPWGALRAYSPERGQLSLSVHWVIFSFNQGAIHST